MTYLFGSKYRAAQTSFLFCYSNHLKNPLWRDTGATYSTQLRYGTSVICILIFRKIILAIASMVAAKELNCWRTLGLVYWCSSKANEHFWNQLTGHLFAKNMKHHQATYYIYFAASLTSVGTVLK